MQELVNEQPARRPVFTEEEINAIKGNREAGLHGLVPARCYYDEEIYKWEVENVLKKNWLAVGRWDWAERPGDYFTLTMFGEPLVITRDRNGDLHCLVNACRHRWAQVVDEGSGNKKVLTCPYHRWTYNLDGTLRAVTVEDIEGLDREKCALRKIRLEVWHGTIFLNFDPNAEPLAPQLAGVEKYIEKFRLGEMRSAGKVEYETSWNYKFSFETGYEAYHHAGIHRERIIEHAPPEVHEPIEFGKNWGIYGGRLPAEIDTAENRFLAGAPPWMTEEEMAEDGTFISLFIAVYPGLITYISPHQISMITTQHISMDRNIAATHISIAPWVLDNPEAAPVVEYLVQSMKDVQAEDTYGCQILQKGVRSKFNDFSVIHPKYEQQLIHYHNWLLEQYTQAQG